MDTGVADRVVELRSQHPSMKAVEIARQVRVSKERVRQILKKTGLPTRFVRMPRPCRFCGHLLDGNIEGDLCRRCTRKLPVTRICFRCGREYQSTPASKSKYCRDCRTTVNEQRARFCMYRRKWEQQKKTRRYRCIFCQGVFDSSVEFSVHRVDTGELSDLDFRKWVMTYRSTHSYWKTLEYFHISQESYKAIRDGKEAPKHH